MSASLQPHESQHTRPPCPSPSPGVHPNSCPSSRWCHPASSSSIIPFSCPQSLPSSESESFPMSQLLPRGPSRSPPQRQSHTPPSPISLTTILITRLPCSKTWLSPLAYQLMSEIRELQDSRAGKDFTLLTTPFLSKAEKSAEQIVNPPPSQTNRPWFWIVIEEDILNLPMSSPCWPWFWTFEPLRVSLVPLLYDSTSNLRWQESCLSRTFSWKFNASSLFLV